MARFQIPVPREPPGFLCRHHSQSPPAAATAAAAAVAAGDGGTAAAAAAAGCQTESHREVHADVGAGAHGGCADNSGGRAVGLAR